MARRRQQPGAGRGTKADGWHENAPRPAVEELRSELLMPIRRAMTPTTRPHFVIVTQGRSGSELLRALLGTHPDVYADLEILDRPVRFPRWYVESRRARNARSVYGFKMKLQDVERFQGLDVSSFLRWLDERGYRIIHLVRENVVAQSLSLVRARRTGEYHRAGDQLASTGFEVDCPELLEACRWHLATSEREASLLESYDPVVVRYEDDLGRRDAWQQACDRVFDRLGIGSVPVGSELARTSSVGADREIRNLAEVRAALDTVGLGPQLDSLLVRESGNDS